MIINVIILKKKIIQDVKWSNFQWNNINVLENSPILIKKIHQNDANTHKIRPIFTPQSPRHQALKKFMMLCSPAKKLKTICLKAHN